MSKVIGEYFRQRFEDCYEDMHKETLVRDDKSYFLLIEDKENQSARTQIVIMSGEDVKEWCRRHAVQLYAKEAGEVA